MRIRSINKVRQLELFAINRQAKNSTNRDRRTRNENIRTANYKYFESYLSIRFVYLLRSRDTTRRFVHMLFVVWPLFFVNIAIADCSFCLNLSVVHLGFFSVHSAASLKISNSMKHFVPFTVGCE